MFNNMVWRLRPFQPDAFLHRVFYYLHASGSFGEEFSQTGGMS
jgi:hypothetical protein